MAVTVDNIWVTVKLQSFIEQLFLRFQFNVIFFDNEISIWIINRNLIEQTLSRKETIQKRIVHNESER